MHVCRRSNVYRSSNISTASEGSQSALKPENNRKAIMFRNYFHITFTVERQPHHWDTAGQPIYCQGCAAKQGTKGTESPTGMWNGVDRTSLTTTQPGYQFGVMLFTRVKISA